MISRGGWVAAILGLAAIAGLLAGTEPGRDLWDAPRQVRLCEALVLEQLRSPATYRRVAWRHYAFEPREWLIEYDAANAYGTPIRGTARCEMAAKPDYDGWPELAAASVNGRALTDREWLIYRTLAEARAKGRR